MIRLIIDLYIFIIILDVILSYLPQLKYHPIAMKIRRLVDFTCAPIRRYLPSDLPFDFSPFIVIVLLKLLIALW